MKSSITYYQFPRISSHNRLYAANGTSILKPTINNSFNQVFGFSQWKAESSSATNMLAEPIEAALKESVGCKSKEQEVRSSDPSKKKFDICDDVAIADVPEKSPVVKVEGEPLVLPMPRGDSLIDVEKPNMNGGSNVLMRTKKRRSKPNVGVAWGKLIS